MNRITDSHGDIIGYLYNMMILNKEMDAVIGLVMGNCVFGKDKEPVGKLFNDFFWHLNGEKLGKLDKEMLDSKPKSPIEKAFIFNAWKILNNVQNHTCIWIEEKKKWHKKGLLFILQEDKQQMA